MSKNNLLSSFIFRLVFGLIFSAAYLSGNAHALTVAELEENFSDSDVVRELCSETKTEDWSWWNQPQNPENPEDWQIGKGKLIVCHREGMALEESWEDFKEYCDVGFREDLEAEDEFKSGFVEFRHSIESSISPSPVSPSFINTTYEIYLTDSEPSWNSGCFFWNLEE